MKQLKFAYKLLQRDLKSGDLRVILVALIIAVAGVSALSSFIMQSRLALENKSGELLGGDFSIRSFKPLSKEVTKLVDDSPLEQSTIVSFYSMLQAQKKLQLVAVKAVDEQYPLKGQLEVANDLDEEGRVQEKGPARGTVWIEPRLFALLDARIGDVIQVGVASLTITKVLTLEPDRVGDRFSFAPRAMMHLQDVAKTKVIQPGSRATYTLLLAGPKAELDKITPSLKSLLTEGDRLVSARESRPSVETALNRGEKYLGLAALVNVVLAGICIAITAQNFVKRHIQTVALLRCFGGENLSIFTIFSLLLVMLGMLGGLLGTSLGLAVQWGVSLFLKDYLPYSQELILFQPFLLGVGLSILLTISFALPSILQLKDIRPVQILRKEEVPVTSSQLVAVLFAVLAMGFFIFWQSQDLKSTVYILITAVTLSCLAYLIVQFLLFLLSGCVRFLPYVWRFSLSWILESRRETIIQLIAFGMAFTVIMMMWLVRNDLLNSWQRQLPPSTHNYFAININPQDVQPFQNILKKVEIESSAFYPIVRGRLTHVNDEALSVSGEPGKRRGIARPLNMTWARDLPADNDVVSGKWFTSEDEGKNLISIESAFAKRLGLKLGDEMTFQFAGIDVKAVVKSIRRVQWDNFKPNFYVIFPKKTVQDIPYTLMTSFYVPPASQAKLRLIVREVPSINLIDTTLVIDQVRNILNIITRVIGLLSLMTFVIGLLLLLSVMLATQKERRAQQALIRAMGASNRQLVQLIFIEFAALGILAGGLAALFAEFIAWYLAVEYFKISFAFNFWVLVVGLLAGGVLIGGFALFAAVKMFRSSPMLALR